jgi:hypothetical protein
MRGGGREELNHSTRKQKGSPRSPCAVCAVWNDAIMTCWSINAGDIRVPVPVPGTCMLAGEEGAMQFQNFPEFQYKQTNYVIFQETFLPVAHRCHSCDVTCSGIWEIYCESEWSDRMRMLELFDGVKSDVSELVVLSHLQLALIAFVSTSHTNTSTLRAATRP